MNSDDNYVPAPSPNEPNWENDADGDGIPDVDDLCPEEFGDYETFGCQPEVTEDSDFDF